MHNLKGTLAQRRFGEPSRMPAGPGPGISTSNLPPGDEWIVNITINSKFNRTLK